MSKTLGANFTLVSSNASFDPLQGYQLTQRYEGTQDALLSLAGAFRLQGLKAEVSTENGKSVLTCVFGGMATQDPNVDPVDRYTLNNEFEQQSIWNNPYVINEALTLGGGMTSYKKFITDAVANEAEVTFAANLVLAPRVYRALVRGVDVFEVRTPTLTRTRTIPVNSSSRLIVSDLDTVWTTTALTRVFALPVTISSRLPTNPAIIPEDSVWGWKLKEDSSEYVLAANKIQEERKWAFLAWPDFAYTFVLI